MLPLIVGLGLQTPLGTSVDSTWRALTQGRFIRDHARVPTDPAPGTTRLKAIATAAARESLVDAGIEIESVRAPDTALVVGTSKGPIEQWLTPAHCVDSANCCESEPAGLAGLAEQIARGLGIAGPRLTLSAACASGLHALIRGVLLIRSGEMKRVIVVAAESSLHPLFVGNFQRLGVLSPPGYGCRPFDRHRRGFVMSEAAAAVVLESPGLAERRSGGCRPIVVERFALAGDAIHLTGNDPQTVALRHMLAAVSHGRRFDLVHAHGTGTDANDIAELSALEATLPPSPHAPALYSHKGALGHSLGASGLISVVLNCMSHQTGIIPGNVHTFHPLDSAHVRIRQQPTEGTIERSLAIAAGFGGAMAAVSLSG